MIITTRGKTIMFEGVFSALITPFRDGRVDTDALERLIEYQIEGGINGVVPCGTTGESATLDHAEHMSVINSTVEIVNGRVPVIAGTGSNSTTESITLTRFAKEAGASGALLITPYYNKPTQEGLYRHYRAIAEAADLPLILYNVPGRTVVDLEESTVVRLSKRPNIVAIKEATANMERASRIHHACGNEMALISGDDATFFPFLAVGGRGVISVSANVAPVQMSALWQAWKKGDLIAARREHERLLELHQLLFVETNPIPIKAAMAMAGMIRNELRLPMTVLSEARRGPLAEMLRGFDLTISE